MSEQHCTDPHNCIECLQATVKQAGRTIIRLRAELKNAVPYRPRPCVFVGLPKPECYEFNPCAACRTHYGIKMQGGGA